MAVKLHEVNVSDHALLRYLERGMGLDVEAIRRGIAERCAAGAALGATKIARDGLVYALNAYGCVVTVVHGDGPRAVLPGHKHRRIR